MKEKLIEVFYNIRSKFAFNEDHYPALANLPRDGKYVFKVKHCLLRLQRNLYAFLHIDNPTERDFYLNFTTDIFISLAMLANTLDYSADEFATQLQLGQSWSNEMFVQRMGLIAAECEKFDKGEQFNISVAINATAGMLNLYYSKIGFE